MSTSDGEAAVPTGFRIRQRADEDLDALVAMVTLVQERDGYPACLVGPLRDFLDSPRKLTAWVAEEDGRLLGHVALHSQSSDAVMEAAGAWLGLPHHRLGVVARLAVGIDARGRGIGRRLLDTAAGAAWAIGRHPILDVLPAHEDGIALYERAGWVLVGSVTSHYAEGLTFDELVYVSPKDGATA